MLPLIGKGCDHLQVTALPVLKIGPPLFFEYDRKADGWTLEIDVLSAKEDNLFTLWSPLGTGEELLTGNEMLRRSRRRARKIGALAGQHHAERLLTRQQEIPVEWRTVRLVFLGTIWVDKSGYRRVMCLEWHNAHWEVKFICLGAFWFKEDQVIRVKKEE